MSGFNLDDLGSVYDAAGGELPDEDKLANAEDVAPSTPTSNDTRDVPAPEAGSASSPPSVLAATEPSPAGDMGLAVADRSNHLGAFEDNALGGGPMLGEGVVIDAEYVVLGDTPEAPPPAAEAAHSDEKPEAAKDPEDMASHVREEVHPTGGFPFEEVDVGQRAPKQSATDPFAGMGNDPIGAPHLGAGQGQPMPHGNSVGPGGYPGGGPGGAGAQGVGALGELAGQVIGATVAGVAGVGRGMARSIHSYLGRSNAQAQASATNAAETAIVDAELAANHLIRAAKEFRTMPEMKSFIYDLETAARPKGRLVSDIIHEMKPGGSHPDLWSKFKGILDTSPSVAAAHIDLGSHMASYQSAWTRAADAVDAAGGSPEALWGRLDKATSNVRTATQDIPAEEGKSFGDMARQLLETLRETFCKIFRIAPTRAAAPAP